MKITKWTPEQFAQVSAGVEHFLYFNSEEQACAAAESLRGRGWLALANPADDKFIVHAAHTSTGREDMEAESEEMARFAESFGGEYDGWQKPVSPEDLRDMDTDSGQTN